VDNAEVEFRRRMFVSNGDVPVILHSKSLIQIGDRLFFFLLPLSKNDKISSLAQKDPSLLAGVMSVPGTFGDEIPGTETNPAGLSLALSTTVPFFNWKRGAKEKCRKSFLIWGFGRWYKILEETGDPERSIEDMQLFALSLLKQIQIYLEADGNRFLFFIHFVQ
jgi:hypothetical protein